ncbi:MAG: hypothetical protein ABJH52_07505 [Henriciella sp.]
MRKLIALSTAVIFVAGASQAEKLQFECTNLQGKHYYGDGGQTPEKNEGWIDDGISNGVFVTQFDLEDQSVTYRYKDATGVWYDPAQDEGGFVALVSMNNNYEGSFQIMIVTEGPDASNVTSVVINGIGSMAPTMLMNATRHGYINSSRTFYTEECTMAAG